MDRFADTNSGIAGPAVHAFAVLPDDGADLPEVTRALYIGGGGALRAVMQSGATVVFAGIADGAVLPVRVRRVTVTGTTATDIVALT